MREPASPCLLQPGIRHRPGHTVPKEGPRKGKGTESRFIQGELGWSLAFGLCVFRSWKGKQ